MTNARLLALVVLAASPRLVAAAPPLHLDVGLEPGEVALFDRATSSVTGGDIDSSAYMPVLGIGAHLQPWRELVVEGDYRIAKSTPIDTLAVSPSSTDVGYWRVGAAAGWRFETPQLGVVRSLTATLGWDRERWSSQKQSQPGLAFRQITPSFTRDELRLRGEADARFASERLDVRAGVALVPLLGMSEEFATNGSGSSGLGFDVDARASYDLGNVLGRFGHLEVGVGADFGMRWIGYSGEGTRTASTGQRVSDVSERFSRITGLALVTWRFPGSAAGATAGRDDEADRAEVVGREIRIKSTIFFNPASAMLDLPRSQRAIRSVVLVMRESPDVKVQVRGYTDNEGDPAANKELSRRRAQAVADAMVAMGIARDRVTFDGFGDAQPLASNASEDGRARNRRVEFGIE